MTRLVTRYDDEYTDIHHDFRDDLFKVCPHTSPCTHRDADLFTCKINAGIVRDLATGIALASPKALILVISNPVNSTVPIVAEVLKQHGVFDPKRYSSDTHTQSRELLAHRTDPFFRLFGVTTLDVVRASTFVAEKLGKPSLASSITVPVIGGHSGVTVSLHMISYL